MDPIKKAARLKLIKAIGERHTEWNETAAGGIEPTKADVMDTVLGLDAFRENERDMRSDSEVINSDER